MAAERIDVVTAHEMWRAGDTVIDVRTADEYARGHIAGALNVPNWCYVRHREAQPSDDRVEEGQLWPYHRARLLYWCPLDRTNTLFFRQRDMQVCSYMMNGAVSGYL